MKRRDIFMQIFWCIFIHKSLFSSFSLFSLFKDQNLKNIEIRVIWQSVVISMLFPVETIIKYHALCGHLLC